MSKLKEHPQGRGSFNVRKYCTSICVRFNVLINNSCMDAQGRKKTVEQEDKNISLYMGLNYYKKVKYGKTKGHT